MESTAENLPERRPHADTFFQQVLRVAAAIDCSAVERLAQELGNLRDRRGRLFVLGLGGSAGNASHAVNDFRKLCDIEAYAPTDNVSELTARANDEGLDTIFTGWMEVSRAGANDALLVLSVGGGDIKRGVSLSLVSAVTMANARGLKVFGILGRAGYTASAADLAILVPVQDQTLITPLAEAFQSVVWHCLASHPLLQRNKTKW